MVEFVGLRGCNLVEAVGSTSSCITALLTGISGTFENLTPDGREFMDWMPLKNRR